MELSDFAGAAAGVEAAAGREDGMEPRSANMEDAAGAV
jgi:hypothetical protein